MLGCSSKQTERVGPRRAEEEQGTSGLWFRTFGIEWAEAQRVGEEYAQKAGEITPAQEQTPGAHQPRRKRGIRVLAAPGPTHLSHLEWP